MLERELEMTQRERSALARIMDEHDGIARRFTRPRQMVYLFIRRAGNHGVGAYALLAQLKAYSPGAKPATVYRALDYLLRLGLVVKIDSQSKFFARAEGARQALCLFMVCAHCGSVQEFIDKYCEKRIQATVTDAGCTFEKNAIEISVLCETCREQPASAH